MRVSLLSRSSAWRTYGAIALGLGLAACGAGDTEGVTINGDVAGLDSLALRADSLLANAGRAPLPFDSAPKVASAPAEGSGDGTLVVAGRDGGGLGTDAGNEMSRRAQARGDSMARAIAAQLAGSSAGRSRGDSVRGVLTFTGSEPARQVVLKQGDQLIRLSGMATTGLARLVGTEIVAHGVQITPLDVVVNDYVVRAANGVPAFDGTLEEGGALRLTDGSGVRRVPLPAALRSATGARVWVAVRDGRAITGGVITR